jgi:hypothetical protein
VLAAAGSHSLSSSLDLATSYEDERRLSPVQENDRESPVTERLHDGIREGQNGKASLPW